MADHRARIYGTEEDKVNCPVRVTLHVKCELHCMSSSVTRRTGLFSHWLFIGCVLLFFPPFLLQFYIKIGACRHRDRCGRQHVLPLFSCTILIPHMWQLPAPDERGKPKFDNDACDEFVEDVRPC
jgi:hypothetical protein